MRGSDLGSLCLVGGGGSRTRTRSCVWTCSPAGLMSGAPPFLHPHPFLFSLPFSHVFLITRGTVIYRAVAVLRPQGAGGVAAELLPQYG